MTIKIIPQTTEITVEVQIVKVNIIPHTGGTIDIFKKTSTGKMIRDTLTMSKVDVEGYNATDESLEAIVLNRLGFTKFVAPTE